MAVALSVPHDSDNDSMDEFFDAISSHSGGFLGGRDFRNLGEDYGSDISIEVSSVHTSDLSDFESEESSETEDNPETDVGESDVGEIDDDYYDQDDEEWQDVVEDHEIRPFREQVGPKHPLPLTAKPIDFFLQLFPIAMFQLIVTESMRYARQKGSEFVTTLEEIKAYMGMLYVMGIVQLPAYRDIWSRNKYLNQPTLAKVMSRNRYEKITRFFHVNDSTTNPPRNARGHDVLHKIRPFIESAKTLFPMFYAPHKNVAVDEAMVKFKGRCSFLQYVPSKPCKWGLKAWALADSESYYLLDFNIYTGKKATDARLG